MILLYSTEVRNSFEHPIAVIVKMNEIVWIEIWCGYLLAICTLSKSLRKSPTFDKFFSITILGCHFDWEMRRLMSVLRFLLLDTEINIGNQMKNAYISHILRRTRNRKKRWFILNILFMIGIYFIHWIRKYLFS